MAEPPYQVALRTAIGEIAAGELSVRIETASGHFLVDPKPAWIGGVSPLMKRVKEMVHGDRAVNPFLHRQVGLVRGEIARAEVRHLDLGMTLLHDPWERFIIRQLISLNK